MIKIGIVALDSLGLLAETEGEDWRGRSSGTVMGYIHLHVSDMLKTKEYLKRTEGSSTIYHLSRLTPTD
ncbi:hypothetical protein [Peribacillus loiseleuriae]|uniref:Uncharacterized protein n=1 Tax=Peribacillus loiseleuriae TaxID=1679170 RepID=A0A0K9GQB2_9BACI|nr:hypothetical protein [Peribacillus loiseleuriae]KMY48447.1 hypothetical protein AC625_02065 [Peribacillus loiseleuriae]